MHVEMSETDRITTGNETRGETDLSDRVRDRLKVPKREIFDRSDFPDYYTIKSLRVGDFGVKIKKILQNI